MIHLFMYITELVKTAGEKFIKTGYNNLYSVGMLPLTECMRNDHQLTVAEMTGTKVQVTKLLLLVDKKILYTFLRVSCLL